MWLAVQLVVIDEMSMMSPSLLDAVDKSLRLYRQQPQSVFGGCLVLLTGDFYQLPPVKGISLSMALCAAAFTTSNKKKADSTTRGLELFRTLIGVLCLSDSKRFDFDKAWKIAMMLARQGLYPPPSQTILILRTTGKLDQTDPAFVSRFASKSPTIVTNSNVDRHEINWAVIRKIARERLVADSTPDEDANVNPDPFRAFLLPAALGVQDSVAELTESEKRQIRAQNDRETGNLLALLPVFVGMRARITDNSCIDLKLANGELVTVFHISFPEETKYAQVQQDLPNVVMPSAPPLNVYVQIDAFPPDGPKLDPSLPASWPGNVIALPLKSTDFTTTKLRELPLEVSIRQFPMVPGYALTVYGVQGLALDSLCVHDPTASKSSWASLYVMLSRVTSSAGLWLDFDLPKDMEKDFLSKFQPPKELKSASDAIEAKGKETENWIERLCSGCSGYFKGKASFM